MARTFVRVGTVRGLLLVFSALVATSSLHGQISSADILGNAFDPSGAALVGVKISATQLSTGITRDTTSSEAGSYLFSTLPIGHYRLKAEINGFRNAIVEDVAVAEGIVLGSISTWKLGRFPILFLSLRRPPHCNRTAHRSVPSSIKAVQDLPLNGRNFIRLAQLSAGANEDGDNSLQSGNRPDDRRSSTAVAVNGQHGYNNNFMIDGLDDNERYIGSIVVKPAMDALAEFKLSPTRMRRNWAAPRAASST